MRDGMLTSRLGSVIGRPSRVSSAKTSRQAAPKLIVWWAWPGSSVWTPTCTATQDGEYTGRRGRRKPGTSVSGRSTVTTTASAGSRSPSSSSTPVTRDPLTSSSRTSVSWRRTTPASAAAAAIARGTAAIPPTGCQTPAPMSSWAMTA